MFSVSQQLSSMKVSGSSGASSASGFSEGSGMSGVSAAKVCPTF